MRAFGTAVVHALVAILLACPYFCLTSVAAVAGTSAVQSDPSGGCDCCSRTRPQDSKPCPGQPDSKQPGGTCLCHGAVMDRHVAAPELHQVAVSYLPTDAAAAILRLTSVERGLLIPQPTCHFPAADSGREVRALIESLLL